MSIEGVKFCDICGGAIAIDDIAPVKLDEGGRRTQLHFHNRNTADCLAQKLAELAEQYSIRMLAVTSDPISEEAVPNQA